MEVTTRKTVYTQVDNVFSGEVTELSSGFGFDAKYSTIDGGSKTINISYEAFDIISSMVAKLRGDE